MEINLKLFLVASNSSPWEKTWCERNEKGADESLLIEN